MSEPTLNTLTQRLDRLERENRRLKVAGTIVLLVLVAVGAMGQVLPKAVPKVVEAERFVLRDAKGKALATLGTTDPLGVPSLLLSDQNGKPRAWLGAGALYLSDQNGTLRAMLDVRADGTGLSLSDQKGKPRAGLIVLADGTPALGLSDQKGKTRVYLTVLADGTPSLSLDDQDKKPRLRLSVATSGPSLVLRDENQKDRAVLGHTALEKTATGTVEQRPASSLVLFDRDGKVIWRAP